jgi:PAS domain S-box-containing protein
MNHCDLQYGDDRMPKKPPVKKKGGTVQSRNRGQEKPHHVDQTLGVRYRALVEQVPAIIYSDSAEEMFKTLYINPQLKTITGYEPEEWINDPDLWARILHPDDRQRVLEEYTRTFAAKQPSISEYRLITRDGRIIWFSDETRLILGHDGKPLFWQGVMIDITARKRAEQVQQAIYRISHAVVTTTSLDELYLSIHYILGELMPVENIYIALFNPQTGLISYPYYVDQYDSAPAPGRPKRGLTEYVLRTRKPLWATTEVFAKLVEQGKVETVGTDSVDWIGVPLLVGERVIGVLVTQSYTAGIVYTQEHFDLMKFISTQVALAIELKLDQQHIADALEYNKTLINSSSLGITAYDVSGKCILANESLARILGTTREQLMEENYYDSPAWKANGLLGSAVEAVASGNETRREVHTTNSAGEELWLDCRFTPFYSYGEPHLLLSVDDITVSKQAEVNLEVYAARLEQSNRDLQEFAYIASHDLQEPLRKVLAFGDRLASKYSDVIDDTGRDYLKRMREASQRMQTLINDLLTFSRVTTRAQPFARMNLDELVHDVVSDLELQIDRTQGKIELGPLPTIEADPTQMHQLMQNLISNALKFHVEGKKPNVWVSAESTANTCRIFVKDDGIGFDEQYLDRIFKPFQRLHSRQEYEGSGMGLAICRRIVERHGGDITAHSALGMGATFIVTLPIQQNKGENSHA